MQSKMYSAALAALAIALVDAAAVSKRQLITFQPGAIVGPTINTNYGDLQVLGGEAVAFRALDEIRNDLLKTGTLVTQLNKATSMNAEDKRVQAAAVVSQVQQNAQSITGKLANFTSLIQGKIPTTPNVGNVGGVPNLNLPTLSLPNLNLPTLSIPNLNLPTLSIPNLNLPSISVPNVNLPSVSVPNVNVPSATLPNLGAPSAPGVPAVPVPPVGSGAPGVGNVGAVPSFTVPALPTSTSIAIGTIGGVVDRLDALVSQAHTLNNQARTQVSLIGSFLETLLTPLLGTVKGSSSRDIANSFKQISSSLDSFFGVLSTLATNGGVGSAQSYINRINEARGNITPALVAGISVDVTV
ncbi:uncharacterized protein CTRU02_214155 [Colletotrichum truncatum]|uniref:Uncharacterized protein n=1 Tax=Colletotrichum truncatum TaxID=5467 RepID=A0ACC3YHP1_COLTU|nr:uncharacterized protein CTRU02_11235 [Colletotrichum truncatum]KAF6785977.1 hypothetical protein CTRU02_11235 [Colletotrichum truncatum]